jgi:hypothetical protein
MMMLMVFCFPRKELEILTEVTKPYFDLTATVNHLY